MPITSPRPLIAYAGTYWNSQRYLRVDIKAEGGRLFWALQGLESEMYELEHYHNNTWTWLRPRNYLVSRGRWVDQPPMYWLVKFRGPAQGPIQSVTWIHETNVPSGETFFKEI
jgi:hypothetical protein